MNEDSFKHCSSLYELIQSPNLVSLEIIPGNGTDWALPASNPTFPFLLQDPNLGIPCKDLLKLYLASSKCFNEILAERRSSFNRSNQSPHSDNLASSSSKPGVSSPEEIEILTAILLLVNPLHTTALNHRRLLIQSHYITPSTELKFTSLLLSGTKEASKSSVLWHHRRWVLRTLHSSQGRASSASSVDSNSTYTPESPDNLHNIDLNQQGYQLEFDLVTKATALYPRNYFSALHRQKLLQSLSFPSLPTSSVSTPRSDKDVISISQRIDILENERLSTIQWIKSHIADYTSMSYFVSLEVFLLNLVDDPLHYVDSNTIIHNAPDEVKLSCPPNTGNSDDHTTADKAYARPIRDCSSEAQALKLKLHAMLSTTLTLLEELLLSYPEREALWNFLRALCIARHRYSYQRRQFATSQRRSTDLTLDTSAFLYEALEISKSIGLSDPESETRPNPVSSVSNRIPTLGVPISTPGIFQAPSSSHAFDLQPEDDLGIQLTSSSIHRSSQSASVNSVTTPGSAQHQHLQPTPGTIPRIRQRTISIITRLTQHPYPG